VIELDRRYVTGKRRRDEISWNMLTGLLLHELGHDDDSFDDQVQPRAGWATPLVAYFRQPGDRADYEYDFGDSWKHEIVLEQVGSRLPNGQRPICLEGARACPPEDCGGSTGMKRC